jgi:hypothetical protein
VLGDGDLQSIFGNGDFDTEAVFTISTGPTVTSTVRGWFTGASDSVLMFGQVQIEAAKPSFMCETADITNIMPKMQVAIDAVSYTVERIEKVGTGVSVVYLKT